MLKLYKAPPVLEVLVQCLRCHNSHLVRLVVGKPENIRCKVCTWKVEVLKVDEEKSPNSVVT
jgi:transcription elongation factor Elf1